MSLWYCVRCRYGSDGVVIVSDEWLGGIWIGVRVSWMELGLGLRPYPATLTGVIMVLAGSVRRFRTGLLTQLVKEGSCGESEGELKEGVKGGDGLGGSQSGGRSRRHMA